MYVINKVDVLLKVPSQCCQSLVCTSNVCDLVDDKQCAIFIVALQMQPRWEAWKESLHLPGPIGDTKAFTVARDMSSSYKGHLLVISQVVSQLGQHMTLSQSTFQRRMQAMGGKQKVMVVKDPCLIKQLIGMEAIGNRANHVSLASIHTIKATLKGIANMGQVAEAFGALATTMRPTIGPGPSAKPKAQGHVAGGEVVEEEGEEEVEVEEEEVEEVPLGDPATKSRYLNVINASWRILLKGV